MSPIVNVAGSSFDYGRVIFAVLEECEHRRRAVSPNEAKNALMDIARKKLDEIHVSYREAHGTESYWKRLEHEVLSTVMPQYIPAAVARSRREKMHQAVWGGGAIVSRIFMLAVGLLLAWAIVKLPFVPAIENVLAIALAIGGFFYPELTQWRNESKHSKLLNRLVEAGEAYQRNRQIHYLSESDLDDVFRPIEESTSTASSHAAASRQSQSQ